MVVVTSNYDAPPPPKLSVVDRDNSHIRLLIWNNLPGQSARRAVSSVPSIKEAAATFQEKNTPTNTSI